MDLLTGLQRAGLTEVTPHLLIDCLMTVSLKALSLPSVLALITEQQACSSKNVRCKSLSLTGMTDVRLRPSVHQVF